jgi:SAM-dependent methyltransferase
VTQQDKGRASTQLNADVPHPARIYDYLLGGKDNFDADRKAARAGIAAAPEVRDIARANRQFLVRAVKFAARRGIRQFIDIGTGIPTSPNVHEVAQSTAPDARVVYVDNDPIVLVHARALMAGPGHGATTVVHADLRDPQAILTHPDVTQVIDFDQPVAILLIAVLHHLTDSDNPAGIVARLLAPAATGSLLILSHLAEDLRPAQSAGVAGAAKKAAVTLIPRRRDQVLGFLDGLDLVEPGLVQIPLWRPDVTQNANVNPDRVWSYAAVAHKL